MNELKTLVEAAFINVATLIRHLGIYLSSPTDQEKQQLQTAIDEAFFTLESVKSFVEKLNDDSEKSIMTLICEIGRSEAELRSFQQKLKEISIAQEAVDESIECNERDITFYENIKQGYESKIKEVTAENVENTLKISWIPFLGTNLLFFLCQLNYSKILIELFYFKRTCFG
jgi:hypothetical protein